MQRHVWSSGFSPPPVGTADLVTVKFQANKHPPLATSPYPEGSSAGSAKSSTGQNHALHNNWLPVDRGEVKHRRNAVTNLWWLRERYRLLTEVVARPVQGHVALCS